MVRGRLSQIAPIEQAVAHTESYSTPEYWPASSHRGSAHLPRPRTRDSRAMPESARPPFYPRFEMPPNRTATPSKGLRRPPVPRANSGRLVYPADTLQRFLTRGNQPNAGARAPHLYMLDESSLASTKQVREFLAKIGSRRPRSLRRRHAPTSRCRSRKALRATGRSRHENRAA